MYANFGNFNAVHYSFNKTHANDNVASNNDVCWYN